MKLSGSANISGVRKFKAINKVKTIKIPNTSFTV